MSDFIEDIEDGEEEGLTSQNGGSDYEITFSHHYADAVDRIFEKADHWVRAGVRPNRIFVDEKKISAITFRKIMRDPLLIQAGVERFIDFRCSLTLSENDVDAVFSSVCYYEQNAEPTYINAYDPELSSVKDVLKIVADNLFKYLEKPLVVVS